MRGGSMNGVALLYGEGLNPAPCQRAGEELERRANVAALTVGRVLIGTVAGHHVEPVLLAPATQSDIAPLPVCGVVAEHEGPIDGHPLSAVRGERVGEGDVPGLDVLLRGMPRPWRQPLAAKADL